MMTADNMTKTVPALNPQSNTYQALLRMAAMVEDHERMRDKLIELLATEDTIPADAPEACKYMQDFVHALGGYSDIGAINVSGDFEPEYVLEEFDYLSLLEDHGVDLYSLYIPETASVYRSLWVISQELADHGLCVAMIDNPLNYESMADGVGVGSMEVIDSVVIKLEDKERFQALAGIAGIPFEFDFLDHAKLTAPLNNSFSIDWYGFGGN